MIQRFPPVVRRRLLSGAVAVPPGKEAVYAQALPALLRLLKTLHLSRSDAPPKIRQAIIAAPLIIQCGVWPFIRFSNQAVG